MQKSALKKVCLWTMSPILTPTSSMAPWILLSPARSAYTCARPSKRQGLTQRQLSWLCGVSERSIIALEVGTAPGIRLDKLLSILESLGIPLSVQADPQFKAAAPDGPPQKEPRPTTYDELFRHITGNTTDPLPYASAETPQEPEDWQRGGF